MLTRSDLPETLAVFPLPGAVVLPRGHLPLHLFEPRYLAMLEEALKTTHRLIGMVQPGSGPGGLHLIGCAGRITQFSETEDGRYMITLTGISRFRVLREAVGSTPYRRCAVSWDGFDRDMGKPERDPGLNREAFFDLLDRYFDQEELRTDWDSLKEAEDEMLINALSTLCPFEPEEKQALLEAPSLMTRRETLVTLMEYALHGGTEETMQ
jgi:Lon protease-like protein